MLVRCCTLPSNGLSCGLNKGNSMDACPTAIREDLRFRSEMLPHLLSVPVSETIAFLGWKEYDIDQNVFLHDEIAEAIRSGAGLRLTQESRPLRWTWANKWLFDNPTIWPMEIIYNCHESRRCRTWNAGVVVYPPWSRCGRTTFLCLHGRHLDGDSPCEWADGPSHGGVPYCIGSGHYSCGPRDGPTSRFVPSSG